MTTDSISCKLSESYLISSIDRAALEQVAMSVYLAQIQKCYGFLRRAWSIARVESFKADSKNELIYLQLLRAAESVGYGLLACNELEDKSVPKDASPRNRLIKLFDLIASVNPKFFPIACEASLPSDEWLSKDQSSIRSALTRQDLLDLATKAEWLLFVQIPIGSNPFRLRRLTPEEWLIRFGKLLGSHILNMPRGTRYLVTTNPNGSVSAQALLVSKDFDKFS
jgi:hypothetical protein